MNSPTGQTHIIAMGPAQLLTAVAALRSMGIDPGGARAFYRGIPSPAIGTVMQRLCGVYQIQYAGLANVNTFVVGRRGLEGLLDICNARISPRRYLKKRLAWVWDDVDSLKSDIVVIAVRHNALEDAFLLAAMGPTKLLFTADGVIVGRPHNHTMRSAERIALGALGQRYPLSCDVWTPSYLASFVRKIGRPQAIEDNILRQVFGQAQSAGALLAPVGYESIILGQHLVLSGLTTELEELTIWGEIFRHLSRRSPGSTLLYKAHPRDRKMKRVLLARSLTGDARVMFTTDENSALPLEAMPMAANTHVYGMSSSALLYAAALGQVVNLLCGRHWPEPLVAEITGFAAESALPIEWIDEH